MSGMSFFTAISPFGVRRMVMRRVGRSREIRRCEFLACHGQAQTDIDGWVDRKEMVASS